LRWQLTEPATEADGGKTSEPAQVNKQFVTVLGQRMAYHESGSGESVVFLHGNPTSSFLWRDIMAALASRWRCLAPDLIGMGDSDKLPDSADGRYDFNTHAQFLDALLDTLLGQERVTLVVHDWGSALGFDWARRHSNRVKGLVYMEAIVRPLDWGEWPEQSRPLFEALRSDAGEDLILRKNIFVERILPASVIRELTESEMAEYRRPFEAAGEDRRPTLDWPRQLPLGGQPQSVCELVADYSIWMSVNKIPKLFINADPGAILVGEQREFCRSWPNQTEVTVPGIHFIQEDSAGPIARAITAWLKS
jgi:haloalkane dehalogenase